jgi:pimeloyl-ACP methyl ester carboxylesterase
MAAVGAGCAGPQHTSWAPLPLPGTERAVVFTADGAGNFKFTSMALRQAVADCGQPIRVATFEWSHGYGRILADQTDGCHARAEGRRLACEVAAFRAARPDIAIYLVGFSAGSSVVLAAAESLPPGSVDGIVLLSPSVSCDYDLRPALRSTRGYLDVFCSRNDFLALGLCTAIFGTADGEWTAAAAGRVGFEPWVCQPGDAELYTRLRQHRWDPCVAWTGNLGGHHSTHTRRFMKAYVLPLLGEGCGPGH